MTDKPAAQLSFDSAPNAEHSPADARQVPSGPQLLLHRKRSLDLSAASAAKVGVGVGDSTRLAPPDVRVLRKGSVEVPQKIAAMLLRERKAVAVNIGQLIGHLGSIEVGARAEARRLARKPSAECDEPLRAAKLTQSYLTFASQWSLYDPFVAQPIPSNPWISDSSELWEYESQTKEVHGRRVRKWAFSLRELLADPAGRQQFERFLDKEFSAENLK